MTRVVVAMMLAVLAACGGRGASPSAANSTGSAPEATDAVPTSAGVPGPAATSVPSPDESVPSPTGRPALCSGAQISVTGTLENRALGEASGLVASRTHPGVLWSHNDGGAQPGIFALRLDGSDLGVHALPVGVVDAEDLAIAGGSTGDDLYLADIGDNGEARRSVAVLRFAEPNPAEPGPITEVERFEFSYPDRPHNAETLLVDETNGVIVIVTKEQADGLDGAPDPFGDTETSQVFEGRLDAPGPVELVPVGTIDTGALERRVDNPIPHPSSLLGFGGVPTGGDVSADGSLVALRTYEAIWLWSRGDGQRIGEVFAGEPCAVASADELQGEAIAFSGDALVTVGEGVGRPIHRIAR